MTLRSKLIGLVALAGLSACGAPPADVDSDDFERIRGVVEPRVRRLMAEYDVPGMAVAVTVRGRSHFFHYGVASNGSDTAVALESDFATAVEDRLLPTLGLTGSYLRVPEHAMARYAWGTDEANEATRVKPGVLDAEAYGLKCTSSDLIRFVQANIDPSRLPEPVRRAVEETHVGYFRVGEMVQGLGWEQYPYPIPLERLLAGNSRAMLLQSNAAIPLTPPQRPAGPTLFNKTGSTGGFGAYVAFVPEEGIGIVMLANRNYPIPARVEAAHGILEHLARRAEQNRMRESENR